ncbi:hypothetical protein DOTSEDRAFT_61803 [Dothistroma septosporum NZE10]|uniref:PLC-like phosphodiesterase n=1 Tax=Dothistroma septosporum (strain NZE10 / CBS 128990) TaxID=675120 RepID=N1PQM1_DOTSN|nr:hypothetical protein DOTSEDRAFT_61803 [Dothistroma septosporum NZE10]
MFPKSLNGLLRLAAGLKSALAQSSSTICNNSPFLCSKEYKDVAYFGAHDSPFLRDDTTDFSTSRNQFYNTTRQLASGVRLVTGQVQYINGTTDLHVCHTSCELLDAGPLSSWLAETKTWMDGIPNDVVTILLVNGAGATNSGLSGLAYKPANSIATIMWPTLQSLVNNGTRAVKFVATLAGKSGATYLMNEFDYIFENNYDNSGPRDFSCDDNRPSNLANETSTVISSGYMPLMKHFLYKNQLFDIQSQMSRNLASAAATCASKYGKAPTFLLFDSTNMGPAIAIVVGLNGVSNAIGRTRLPTEALSETSAAAVLLPQSSSLSLSLGAALLVVLSL